MKSNIRYQVFAEQYTERSKAPVRQLPLLYRLLRKFETHRITKVSQLISGEELDVLDIGCNDGQFLFENRSKWRSVKGNDVLSPLLQVAKKRKFGMRAEFLSNDFGLEPMPYKKHSLDLVVSIATLQYVYDLDHIFTEIWRVLRPEGKLIMEIPNIASFWKRVLFLTGKFPVSTEFVNKWDGGVIHYFTQQNITQFLTKKGFIIEGIYCSGIFDRLRDIHPGLWGGDLIIVCRKPKT